MNDLKNIDDIIYKVNLHPYELDAIIVSLNESLSNNGHLQLIACDKKDMYEIIDDLKNDGYMTCINWYIIDDFKNISATTRGKTFTLRNDWVSCFTNKKGGIL